MEYGKLDNSGPSDNFPIQNVGRVARGVHFTGAMWVPTGTVPHGRASTDMELQIHSIETEAYTAVLKAFIAQSEVLSWGKEGLISELRKELGVSDVEHREILVQVDSDDSIRKIREWRQSTAAQEGLLSNMVTSHKKLKTEHIAMSSSPRYLPHPQPSSTAMPSSFAAHFRDDQWGDGMAIKSIHGNDGQSMQSVLHNRHVPLAGKGEGSLKGNSNKGFPTLGDDYYHKGSDWIEIRETNKLIHEVEKVCGRDNPDPAQVQEAKAILREHERSLLEAIAKLHDVSDGGEL